MRREFGGRAAILTVLLPLSSAADEVRMEIRSGDLWDLLSRLERAAPMTREKVEALLPTTLKSQGGSEAFAYYLGEPVRLENGAVLGNFDVRTRRNDPKGPAFLSFTVEEICITLDEIKKAYRDLEIASTPSGRSPEEETSYSVDKSWGRLTFGFAERQPECLSSITFDPEPW